jgi:hypothetical protein
MKYEFKMYVYNAPKTPVLHIMRRCEGKAFNFGEIQLRTSSEYALKKKTQRKAANLLARKL